MSGKVLLRIGVIALAVGLLIWFLIGTGHPRQYDAIAKDYLYRATVTNVGDFTAAEAKVAPGTVGLLIPKGQDKVEPWSSVIQYAFRNQIRVDTMDVPADGSLSFARIADLVAEIRELKHPPILLVGPNGADSGKVAAAYRLAIQKMPLAEAERLAALPDAPPETTRAIQEFARSYDQALRKLEQKPASAPTTGPAR